MISGHDSTRIEVDCFGSIPEHDKKQVEEALDPHVLKALNDELTMKMEFFKSRAVHYEAAKMENAMLKKAETEAIRARTKLNRENEALQNEMVDLKEKIVDLKSNLSHQKSSCRAAEKQVGVLSQKLELANAKIAALAESGGVVGNADLQAVEAENGTLRLQVAELECRLQGCKAEMEKQFAGKVAKLEADFAAEREKALQLLSNQKNTLEENSGGRSEDKTIQTIDMPDVSEEGCTTLTGTLVPNKAENAILGGRMEPIGLELDKELDKKILESEHFAVMENNSKPDLSEKMDVCTQDTESGTQSELILTNRVVDEIVAELEFLIGQKFGIGEVFSRQLQPGLMSIDSSSAGSSGSFISTPNAVDRSAKKNLSRPPKVRKMSNVAAVFMDAEGPASTDESVELNTEINFLSGTSESCSGVSVPVMKSKSGRALKKPGRFSKLNGSTELSHVMDSSADRPLSMPKRGGSESSVTSSLKSFDEPPNDAGANAGESSPKLKDQLNVQSRLIDTLIRLDCSKDEFLVREFGTLPNELRAIIQTKLLNKETRELTEQRVSNMPKQESGQIENQNLPV